ncbi:MAG: hypothetical protein PF637_14675 [Spirochaetes bacterium]|nr:hypothetical protein [Spirochaetota bacterium]
MKKFLLFILFVVILGGAGYTAYRSVKFTPRGQILVAYDTEDKRIITSSGSGWVIAPYALIPGRVAFYTIETNGTLEVDCSLPLQELELLDDSLYSVSVKLSMRYSVDAKSYIPSASQLEDPAAAIADKLESDLLSEFASIMRPYLNSPFAPDRLREQWPDLLVTIEERCRSRAQEYGISVNGIDALTILKIPDEEIYNYGLQLRTDLMELRKKHLVEREALQHSLDLKSIETGTYYEHLQKISDIIAGNPDVLKYIYIEKLAPSVKMIIPVNSDGYAFGLDKISETKKDVKKSEDAKESKDKKVSEDIDNLK